MHDDGYLDQDPIFAANGETYRGQRNFSSRYIARFYQPSDGNDYMWDELAAAAWIDPTLITKQETRYLNVDTGHGAAYGNTLTWTDRDRPGIATQPVTVQMELDKVRFYDMFVNLMSAPTPGAAH